MANLVRARGWGQAKPPPGSQIDWGHPLAQGLSFAYLGGYQDHVSGFQAIARSGVPGLRGSWGESFVTDSTSGYLKIPWYPKVAGPGSTPGAVTMVWAGDVPATNGAFSDVLCAPAISSWSSPFGWFLRYGTGGAGLSYLSWGTVTGASTFNQMGSGTISPASPPVRRLMLAAVRPVLSTNASLYARGALIETVAGVGTAAVQWGTQGYVLVGNDFVGNPSSLNGATHGLALIYNRALSADQIAWLYAEPYAYMAAPGPKILYIDLGGSGTIAKTGTAYMAAGVVLQDSGKMGGLGQSRAELGTTARDSGVHGALGQTDAALSATSRGSIAKAGLGQANAPLGVTSRDAGTKAVTGQANAPLGVIMRTSGTKSVVGAVKALLGVIGRAAHLLPSDPGRVSVATKHDSASTTTTRGSASVSTRRGSVWSRTKR